LCPKLLYDVSYFVCKDGTNKGSEIKFKENGTFTSEILGNGSWASNLLSCDFNFTFEDFSTIVM
jgi:hypothetical protein